MQTLITIICIAVFACAASGCRTAVPYNGNPATEYREIDSEIRAGQTELAITGTRIEERSASLEQSIASGARTIHDIADIIQQVRSQPIGSDGEEGSRATERKD